MLLLVNGIAMGVSSGFFIPVVVNAVAAPFANLIWLMM
jgi:hypothetical protein